MVEWVVELKKFKEQQEKIDTLESRNQALVGSLLGVEVPKRWQEFYEQIVACIETHNSLYPKDPRRQVEIIHLQNKKGWFRVTANPIGSCAAFVEVVFDAETRTISFTSPTLGNNATGNLLIDLAADNTVKIFLHREDSVSPERAAERVIQPILSIL